MAYLENPTSREARGFFIFRSKMKLTLLAAFILMAQPGLAFAGKKINLAPDYKLDPAAPVKSSANISYVLVERNGIAYKRFSSSAGFLYVIDSQPFLPATIESGQCFQPEKNNGRANLIEAKNKITGADRILLAGGETKITDSEIAAYASLIQKTTYDRCDNYQTAQVSLPSLDIGLSKTVTDKSGMKKTYKLFNTNLGPNLNFGGEF